MLVVLLFIYAGVRHKIIQIVAHELLIFDMQKGISEFTLNIW